MTFTTENIFFLGSGLIFISILISKTGYKFGIPTLLLFLFTGMIFGTDGLGIEFNSPADAQAIGMLSLSVILFTGGMDTRFKDIKPVLGPGLMLSTLGVILTTVFTGLFIYFISRFTGLDIRLSLAMSVLLAATMSSTDSASVFSLLRSQRMGLKYRLRPILELESGSNDPMAAESPAAPLPTIKTLVSRCFFSLMCFSCFFSYNRTFYIVRLKLFVLTRTILPPLDSFYRDVFLVPAGRFIRDRYRDPPFVQAGPDDPSGAFPFFIAEIFPSLGQAFRLQAQHNLRRLPR